MRPHAPRRNLLLAFVYVLGLALLLALVTV